MAKRSEHDIVLRLIGEFIMGFFAFFVSVILCVWSALGLFNEMPLATILPVLGFSTVAPIVGFLVWLDSAGGRFASSIAGGAPIHGTVENQAFFIAQEIVLGAYGALVLFLWFLYPDDGRHEPLFVAIGVGFASVELGRRLQHSKVDF